MAVVACWPHCTCTLSVPSSIFFTRVVSTLPLCYTWPSLDTTHLIFCPWYHVSVSLNALYSHHTYSACTNAISLKHVVVKYWMQLNTTNTFRSWCVECDSNDKSSRPRDLVATKTESSYSGSSQAKTFPESSPWYSSSLRRYESTTTCLGRTICKLELTLRTSGLSHMVWNPLLYALLELFSLLILSA